MIQVGKILAALLSAIVPLAGCALSDAATSPRVAAARPTESAVGVGAGLIDPTEVGEPVMRLDEFDFLLGGWEVRQEDGSYNLFFDRVRFGSVFGIEATISGDPIVLLHISNLRPSVGFELWDLEVHCMYFSHISGVWPIRRVGPDHLKAARYEWRRIDDDRIEARLQESRSAIVMTRIAGRRPIRDSGPRCLELSPAPGP